MPTVLPDDLARFVRLLAPADDDVLAALEALNRERGFPMVGPEVGALLRAVALMVGAERVFEFGSGLGYSAYWFASALPPDGEVVLTDVDPDELETARGFLERGGLADRAAFEAGKLADGGVVIADYLVRVRDDPAFETVALPLGEGITLSVRR